MHAPLATHCGVWVLMLQAPRKAQGERGERRVDAAKDLRAVMHRLFSDQGPAMRVCCGVVAVYVYVYCMQAVARNRTLPREQGRGVQLLEARLLAQAGAACVAVVRARGAAQGGRPGGGA